jgi:hypothetical protein
MAPVWKCRFSSVWPRWHVWEPSETYLPSTLLVEQMHFIKDIEQRVVALAIRSTPRAQPPVERERLTTYTGAFQSWVDDFDKRTARTTSTVGIEHPRPSLRRDYAEENPLSTSQTDIVRRWSGVYSGVNHPPRLCVHDVCRSKLPAHGTRMKVGHLQRLHGCVHDPMPLIQPEAKDIHGADAGLPVGKIFTSCRSYRPRTSSDARYGQVRLAKRIYIIRCGDQSPVCIDVLDEEKDCHFEDVFAACLEESQEA